MQFSRETRSRAPRVVAVDPLESVEELQHRSELVHVSLIVNRRNRSARVIDYLAGNFPQKMAALQQLAVRERIDRLITLVEKEECAGWAKVGFAREGAIPGYYKRSDAYVMGHIVHDPPNISPDGAWLPPQADGAFADRIVAQARKSLSFSIARFARSHICSDTEAANLARAAGQRARKSPEHAPTASPPGRLGRASPTLFVAGRDRRLSKAPEQLVCAEVQEAFGNAFVHLAVPANDENESRNLAAALVGAIDALAPRGVTTLFAFAPARDGFAAAAMLAAGFRKTGVLAGHLATATGRIDAILWSRKHGAADAADAA